MTIEESLEKLQALKARARLGGGEERIEAQHQRGKLTARERIDALLDPGSFEEIDALAHDYEDDGVQYYGDAVVTGWGKLNGRTVCVFAQDFTVFGGSLGEVVGTKIAKLMDVATKTGVPVVGLNDSGGARIQEGVEALAGYGEIFYKNVQASGVIPQISVIMGPCAGGAVYSPALTDFIFMVEQTSQMFLTGPDVIASVTGEVTTVEELGGAASHVSKSGVAHFSSANETDCLEEVKRLISYLPSNNMDDPPFEETGDPVDRRLDDILNVVPAEAEMQYDVRDVIERVVDNGEFMEVHEYFAPNIVVGFGRVGGHPVGVVANQPLYLAGVLDIDSSRKAARFVRFCDSFNIPIVTLVDVPGFLPGVSQEYGGIIAHGAKLVYAYAAATVPKVTVILRKAFGGAYDAMGAKHLGADVNYAWPTAAIAVMAGSQAVNIISRREIQAADDPEGERKRLVDDYRARLEHPYIAAAKGYIDDVIDPRDTRVKIAHALEMLRTKSVPVPPKKHGNIPL
ncbi:MAG: acyl-CoA carboxylase subunit beta [Dehalococcoidia bacterium]|nr:acyl-CoA carboxylase subunit beta [Dehalococcoidia bacterium]MCB9491667.1 acyl-CoA carboxylase subunit beta [Dehalococcoidia bacterium]